MDKTNKKPYYITELEELDNCQGNPEKLKELCTKIRNRHLKDWVNDSKDELGDGKKLFSPFVDKL